MYGCLGILIQDNGMVSDFFYQLNVNDRNVMYTLIITLTKIMFRRKKFSRVESKRRRMKIMMKYAINPIFENYFFKIHCC